MTAVLSLWGLTGPIVTLVEDYTTTIAIVSVPVGSHLPLEAAQTKVFLAYHTDQLAMERLVATMPNAAHEELHQRIRRVYEVGHCSSSSTPGIVAVAAPVFDEYGICASIAVIATDNTLSMSDDAPELVQVVGTARQLTKALGGVYLPDHV
jgi:DNA-binding IclR family transcriptional regulator